MHTWSLESEQTASEIFAYALERLRLHPVPLDGPRTPEELEAAAGETVTASGIGAHAALRIFTETLAPACISVDHPRYLAFIPCAPTETSMLFDLVVGASSMYGGSWVEGAGAIFAENQALAWLARLAGLPSSARGAFVQGGTIGNLSALVTARHWARTARGDAGSGRGRRFALVVSEQAHSSIDAAARVMDVEVLRAGTDDSGRLCATGLTAALEAARSADEVEVFAVVATAGTTNLGLIDDLAGIAEVADDSGIWLHVDGAYGGAALAAPSTRRRFVGIERADSLVIDPHKWLFAPLDCAALLYRDAAIARAAHTQHASYLEPLEHGGFNPSDLAIHLSRRARGLPFWFSLAANGTEAYTAAIERTLDVARYAAREIAARPELSLVREPDLSVVCFERLGWTAPDYDHWSESLLASGTAFVTPSKVAGRTVARFAVVNPETTEADIDLVLDTMR